MAKGTKPTATVKLHNFCALVPNLISLLITILSIKMPQVVSVQGIF